MHITAEQIIAYVEDLSRECDERHAHADMLAQQVIALGGIPIPYEQSSPWDVGRDPYEGKLEEESQEAPCV